MADYRVVDDTGHEQYLLYQRGRGWVRGSCWRGNPHTDNAGVITAEDIRTKRWDADIQKTFGEEAWREVLASFPPLSSGE